MVQVAERENVKIASFVTLTKSCALVQTPLRQTVQSNGTTNVWYPNRVQWLVMWGALILAFLLWLAAKECVDVRLSILALAAFLVWVLEGRKKTPKPYATKAG